MDATQAPWADRVPLRCMAAAPRECAPNQMHAIEIRPGVASRPFYVNRGRCTAGNAAAGLCTQWHPRSDVMTGAPTARRDCVCGRPRWTRAACPRAAALVRPADPLPVWQRGALRVIAVHATHQPPGSMVGCGPLQLVGRRMLQVGRMVRPTPSHRLGAGTTWCFATAGRCADVCCMPPC